MMRLFLLLSLALVVAGCAASRRPARQVRRHIQTSPVFAKSFTGFVLRDATTGQVLCDVNGDHYFTPASCLKVLTLATCLEVLGDSVPGMRYYPIPDCESCDPIWYIGWFVGGTGDPTFLHPKFQAWQQPFNLLKTNALIGLKFNDIEKERLGRGWSWDDYSESYSAELSEFPLYGNVVQVTKIDRGCGYYRWQAEPPFFQAFLRERDDYDQWDGSAIFRQEHGDTISLPYYSEHLLDSFTKTIPIWQANAKTIHLLLDTLHWPDTVLPIIEPGYAAGMGWRTLYSTPLDTVLRRMMYQSDNFIAEQMLLVCAGVKYDILQQDTIIKWAKDSLLAPPITNNPSTNQPRWVDGSGLSRYNLVTPRYLTEVLWKLWREQPRDRLLSLFPTPGAPETTLDWWQPTPSPPWLYAKTGSMSGVQCMTGYLLTRRGRRLMFSFMNNNFVGSGKPWKEEMRRVLEGVREKF